MTHQTCSSPTARIAVNKNVLKTYGDKVFMANGQEFEIFLSNMTTTTVMAKIKINGEYMSNGGLVLRPGQTYWLDCNWDTRAKMKFNTYEIQDSPEAMAAIAKNGMVEVEFYKEKAKPFRYTPITYNHYSTPYTLDNSSMGTNFTVTGSAHFNDDLKESSTPISSFCCSTNTIETGRIEEGSMSSQQFSSVNMDFDCFHSWSNRFQILPESKRLAMFPEDIKRKCCNCGRKAKRKDVFCSKCGTKLA